MGVQITSLLKSKEIDIGSLSGRVLAVDSYNMLYQFLSTIRQRDGSLLRDSKGNITSHLSGLFNRTINLMKLNLNLIYVFDGAAPRLKQIERERREAIKEEAHKKYKEAVQREDIEEMRKFASRTSRLSEEMINESKEVLDALGVPVLQAPSEGEAQAAELTKGMAYAVASQDTDSLLFGAKRVVKNLTMNLRRKKPGKLAYGEINPELIELEENLKSLNLSREQLVCLAMLVGTDYNVGGITGVGPKNALKIVQEYKVPEKIFQHVNWSKYFENSWEEVFELFINPEVVKCELVNVEWKKVDRERVIRIMCDKHEFSQERINNALEELEKITNKKQKGLSEFF